MPEGDTIYRTARALEKALAGRVVTAFETAYAKLASANDNAPVAGRTVEKVEARGKWCLIFFSGDLILLSHMLMSGSWHIYRTGERWKMLRRAMRVVVTCGEMQGVLFNAQVAEFHTTRSLERYSMVPKLGPDVLGEGFTIEHGIAALRERMASHPADEVGVALLNQQVLAGLGNVYKSEVPFMAGVNPFRALSTLTASEIDRMVELSLRFMKANVNVDLVRGEMGEGIVTYTGARRTTGAMQQSDRVWVYGRQGRECRRCGTPVMRRLQGEQARPTYWCPVCQPWVPAAGQSKKAPVGRTTLVARRRIGC
jgi:endonuclease-8